MFIVARRWDRLGARLHAMSNAAAVAAAIGAGFRYAWPRAHPANADIEVNRQEEIFSPDFRSLHEISLTALNQLEEFKPFEAHSYSRAEAQALAVRSPDCIYVDVSDPFGIIRFRGETSEEASVRFRRAFRSFEWLYSVEQAIESIRNAAAKEPFCAIHMRRGDLIKGEWRQFLSHEKYIPTQFYTFASAQRQAEGERVVAFSDDETCLRLLATGSDDVVRSDDLIPGLRDMTELQRALLDILAMSEARQIIGPPASAFSGLAAALAGRRVKQPGDLCPHERWAETLLSEEMQGDRSSLHPAIVARDTCWTLDVLDDVLTTDAKLALSEVALVCDNNFCGAQARRARALAQVGNHAGAADALAAAEPLARAAEVTYRDPLFHLHCLAVEVLCRQVLHSLLISGPNQSDKQEIDQLLDRIKYSLDLNHSIQPFMIPDVHHILFNIRFQFSCIENMIKAARAGMPPRRLSSTRPLPYAGAFEAVTKGLLNDPLLAMVEGFSAELAGHLPRRDLLREILTRVTIGSSSVHVLPSRTGFILNDLLNSDRIIGDHDLNAP